MKTESARQGFSSVSEPSQIQKIAVVGGFKGFENDPECKDFKMVMPALDYMRRSGISVSQKPEFDTINFADKRNFLDEDHQYDMVFIAHIPNGRNLSWTRLSFDRFSFLLKNFFRDGKFENYACKNDIQRTDAYFSNFSCLEKKNFFSESAY